MKIDEARVEELRRLYREAYGQDISIDEAQEMIRRLLSFYDLLLHHALGGDGSDPRTPE